MTQPQPTAQPASTGANPSTVQALTQPGYLQGVAGYNPSYANYDPAHFYRAQAAQLGGGLINSLSPQATEAQLQQSMLPQTQNAWQNLNQQLADFGVQGGQAIQAGDQLSGQLTSSLAPAMASAIQNAQANQLGAGEFNTGALNNMRQFNMGEKNQMGLQNAAEALNAGQFNAGAANQAGQFNANNANAANQYNVGVQNQNQQQLLNAILGNYGQQMQDIYGMGQGLQSGLTQQGLNYGQDITTNPGLLGDITGLASVAAPFFTGGFGGFGGSTPQTGGTYYGTQAAYP